MRFSRPVRLGSLALVLVVAAACKKSGTTTQTTAASATSASTAPSVSLPKGTAIDPAATVQAPPLTHLVPTQTFELDGKIMVMELCRMDASAPPIFAAESSAGRARIAASADGAIWVLDHSQKLRHYVNRSPRGCELVLDRAFGDHGTLDLATQGNTYFARVLVDSHGGVLLSGDKTMKLEGGKLVDHGCAGEWLLTDPTTKLAVGSRTTVTRDGACESASASYGGYDPNAPQYDAPKPIGLFGDEIVVHGIDMKGTTEVHQIGFHSATGAQRVKVAFGDKFTHPEAATSCGDALCVFGSLFDTIGISRYTRDGHFAEVVNLKIDGLSDATMTGAGDGNLWISGSVRGTYGENGAAPKDGYAGAIFRVHAAPTDAPTSPSIAAALAAPRADEPAHDTIVGPAKGMLRGQPFVPIKIAFEYTFGHWRLVASNAHGSHLSSELLVAPAPGVVSIARAAGPKANTNAFLTTEDNGAEKMSSDLAGSAAHWIVIDRWDVKPYDKTSKQSWQEGGYASGRVWIDMPNGEGKTDGSRLAGAFEGAVVTYSEDPSTPK